MEPIRVSIEAPPSGGSLAAAENMIRAVPGVLSVRREPGKNELVVEAADTVETEAVLTAIRQAGAVGTLVG
jgi:hypothetical protein